VVVPTLDALEADFPQLVQGMQPVPVVAAPKGDGPSSPVALVPITNGPPAAPTPVPAVKPVPGEVPGGGSPQPLPKPVVAAPQPKGNAAPAPAVTPGAPSPNGDTKVYWVPPGGKRFYEVARDTLGDVQRWHEIW